MVMFVLNLLFDFGSNDGLFEDEPGNANPNDGTVNSKHWLTIPSMPAGGVPAASFNTDDGTKYKDLGASGTLLIKSTGVKHFVGLRIAPIQALDPAATAELVVAFGRPAVARQRFASPFRDQNSRSVSFIHVPPAPRAAGKVGWFVPLRQIQPPIPVEDHVTHRYEFAVGIEIVSAGQKRQYGEDPQFDVGL
jgi:hypothetical protein